MKTAGALATLLVGLALWALSMLWATLFPAANVWTDEKSNELSHLGSETNRLKFALVDARENPRMHAGKNSAEIEAEYQRTRASYDALQAEFVAARDRPQAAARLLRWAGVVLVVLGAVGVIAK